MNLIIVPGMWICSSFLISVCIFIVSKALLISSATVIGRAGGAIWLNPFATVLFTVCSAVTVECCVGVFGMFTRLCKEEGSSPVPLRLLRGGIWACMRCPCQCLCWVLGWEQVPAEILAMMEERDDLRKQDPASPRLSTMNDENTKATSDNKRREWIEFVESIDHRTDSTKLWRTIKGIDSKSKQTAENEGITFT